MKKRRIITICGVLGSGKSTAAKRVASALGYPHFSGGDFMRALADERNMTLAALGLAAQTDEGEIDREIDRRQKDFMATHEDFVIDSRLGWFWAPDSFKVFLSLDPDTSAARVFDDMERNARHGEIAHSPKSIADIKERLAERFESERHRYQEYYGIENHFDPAHYDLVIDTKTNDIPTVEKMILDGYNAWLQKK